MNRILISFNILISFSAINFVHGKNQEIALLFHTETNTVANQIHPKENEICEKCATACPLRTRSTSIAPKFEFNNQHSISRKIFFVEKIYSNDVPMRDIDLKICETPFELTLVQNKRTGGIEFGYELYFDKSLPNGELLIEGIYETYKQVSFTPPSTKPTMLNRVDSFRKSYSFPRKNKRLLMGDKNMGFIWIPVFNLSYNGIIQSPNRVSYETSVNVPDSSNICQNYRLGAEIYGEINVAQIYKQDHLDDVFKNTITPRRSPKDPSYDLAPEMETVPGHVCITQWNLVPEKYFHYYSPKSLSCSYLTTVPVWCYLVDEILRRLDEYIDVMTRIIPAKKLQITSGTSGTLHMYLKEDLIPKETIFQGSKPFVSMYLYHQESSPKVPIPAIIYKLIEYKSSTCPQKEINCWYSIFIEIYNSPYIRKEDRICNGDIMNCTEYGWTSFYQDDVFKSSFVKCCQTTKSIERKLKLRQEERQSKYYIFNLNGMKEMADEEMKRLQSEKPGNTQNAGVEPEAAIDAPSGSHQPNPGNTRNEKGKEPEIIDAPSGSHQSNVGVPTISLI